MLYGIHLAASNSPYCHREGLDSRLWVDYYLMQVCITYIKYKYTISVMIDLTPGLSHINYQYSTYPVSKGCRGRNRFLVI